MVDKVIDTNSETPIMKSAGQVIDKMLGKKLAYYIGRADLITLLAGFGVACTEHTIQQCLETINRQVENPQKVRNIIKELTGQNGQSQEGE